MTSQIIPVEPFDFIAFGGTGDLAERKLLPALYQRQRAGQFSEPTRIIGTSRAKMSHKEYREFARKAISDHVKAAEIEPEQLETFLARLHYVAADGKSGDGFDAIRKQVGESDRIRVFYMAVAPALFGDIAKHLKASDLISQKSRIVVEKPIGRDLASARTLNDQIGSYFDEHQIFRIDHYLGKEAVQNLLALRFGNTLFEPLWRREWIASVQITVTEKVGVEGRGDFYDKTGALRDMVQNHLLQLLCMVAMEPPSNIESDSVRDEKLKVLRSLRPIGRGEVEHKAVRGQYRAGAVDGEKVCGYAEEEGIAPESKTETFVALKAEIDTWRWAGVPFYLRTGKRMQERLAEIVVNFRQVPHCIFDMPACPQTPNRLVIRLQPDESVKLYLLAKQPGGDEIRLRPVFLDLDFDETFKTRRPDAYERLLTDVIRGRLTLFMRGDELEEAWKWVEPILDAWQASYDSPKTYQAGSWGPAASTALLSRDGFCWPEES